jgi:hypothetical protein
MKVLVTIFLVTLLPGICFPAIFPTNRIGKIPNPLSPSKGSLAANFKTDLPLAFNCALWARMIDITILA